MSSLTSRFKNREVQNEYNIWIDTSKASIVGSNNKGDDSLVNLCEHSIECEDGEYIKISLSSFSMHNNLTMIDINNSKFRLTCNGSTAGIQSAACVMPSTNVENLNELANVFADTLAEKLTVFAQNNGAVSTGDAKFTRVESETTPLAGSMASKSNRLMSVTLRYANSTGVQDHTFANNQIHIQCYGEVGDSYLILGGRRIDAADNGTDITSESFKITRVDANNIKVESFFPMQRMSDEKIYLRIGGLANTNIETAQFSGSEDSTTHRYLDETLSSNILGCINRDTEFIHYQNPGNDEFFVNIQSRKISHLRLMLTDRYGRKLGRILGEHSNTASGLVDSNNDFVSNDQSTQGNLCFTCCLKIEQIKAYDIHNTPVQPSQIMPQTHTQNPLLWSKVRY